MGTSSGTTCTRELGLNKPLDMMCSSQRVWYCLDIVGSDVCGPSLDGRDDLVREGTDLAFLYQLSRKSNPVFRMELLVLNWENVGLVPGLAEASSSFSALLEMEDDLDKRLEENTSSRLLLTDGSVLWDRSHPATVEDTLTGGAGFGEMEMDAGVALTATGGWGAGGFGARCFVDLVEAGG